MKANQYARTQRTMRKKTDTKYKIPIKDRQRYMGSNEGKWVSKATYLKYIAWVKNRKPKRS